MKRNGPLPLQLASIALVLSVSLMSRASFADDPPGFILEWGSSGSGNGQFSFPSDVTIDEDGNVYVSDASANRIQKFDSNGNFILKWGTSGSTTGKFSQPHGICADRAGHIYVADSNNGRIQKFTTAGVFVSAFGLDGSGDGEFEAPRGVDTDAAGNVYVADTFNNRIQKFDSNGVFLMKWGTTGSGTGQFLAPWGIDVEGGSVYVADFNNHRVQVFSTSGVFQAVIGSSGSGNGEFTGPPNLTVEGSVLYVSDNGNYRVQKLSTAGAFLAKWGFNGNGPGQFNDNRGIEGDGTGTLYVVDTANDRIQKFSGEVAPEGNVLAVGTGLGLPGPGTVTIPVSLKSIEAATALEFRIADAPDWFHVTAVTTKNRASNFSASFVDDGDVRVILYNVAGGTLGGGNGEIVDMTGTIDPSAVEGDSAEFSVTTVLMADGDGNPASITGTGGTLYVARIPGDLNGDNVSDVGDIVRLVEIILGTGDPPTAGELSVADCNLDTEVDLYDIPCLVDAVLGNPSSPGRELEPLAGNLLDFVVNVEQGVKAVQLTFPAGTDFESTAGMQPFDVLSGANARGDRVVIAFDPRGGSWAQGSRSPWRAEQVPSAIRAYGPGGRPLPVQISGGDITIGAPLPPGLVILSNQPNPFLGQTAIRYSVDRTGPVRLSVFDIRGGLISTSAERNVEAGEHTWVWNPLQDNGRRLSAGIYIAVVEGLGTRAPVRLVLLGN